MKRSDDLKRYMTLCKVDEGFDMLVFQPRLIEKV